MNFRARRDNHASAIPSILMTKPMIGVSMLVESTVFTSSQAKEPAIREKPFPNCLLSRHKSSGGWVAAAWEWAWRGRRYQTGLELGWPRSGIEWLNVLLNE